MKVIYIAGPYRAPTIHGIVANIRRAEDAAIEVLLAGGVPLCPHANTALLDGVVPDEVFLAGGVELLSRCDALYLIPGWKTSAGTKAELLHAKRKGIPILDDYLKLRDWLDVHKDKVEADAVA